MTRDILVDDSHFAYLRLQRGAISDLADNFPVWHAAYEESLRDDFASMAPFLPERCRSVLDVGSGLGGIDVVLDRHYGGGLHVRLLDGESDDAGMNRHDRTFNDMRVAVDFQHRNGVKDASSWGLCVYPPKGGSAVIRLPESPAAFDVIVSLQSWCFHYPPDHYLDFVRFMCGPNSVVIIDVRNDKPEWLTELAKAFITVACARSRPKFNRMVFRAA